MTTYSTVVAASLASIAAINAEVTRLTEAAKTARLDAMQPFLDALVASGEVSIIVVRGYTPGFNDGEPCEHSGDFWVNLKEIMGEEIADSIGLTAIEEITGGWVPSYQYDAELRRYVDNPDIEKTNAALAEEYGHVYAPPAQEILDAIRTLIFDTVEEEEGTDYYRAYVLKDGKFEVFSGEYDCGH